MKYFKSLIAVIVVSSFVVTLAYGADNIDGLSRKQLIRMARAKIIAYRVSIKDSNKKERAYKKAVQKFNNAYKTYKRLFAKLPKNNPFEQLLFVSTALYTPIKGVLEFQKETNILNRAIKAGDLDTIKDRLKVKRPDVRQPLGELTDITDRYNKHSQSIKKEIVTIRDYINQYNDLIQKAKDKIEEHEQNIQKVTEKVGERSEAVQAFGELNKEYNEIFGQLPKGHPFSHLIFLDPGELALPIREAIEKSQTEIDTLLKAIEEGDLDTIRERLGVEIEEVEQALLGLEKQISQYEGYIKMLEKGIIAIRDYINQYNDLIQKAEDKIEEHEQNIQKVTEKVGERSEAVQAFGELNKEYNEIFGQLPKGHPFEPLIFAWPTLYVPVREALEKSQDEIDTLLKAIEEGDLETIREHLGIEIEEVEYALRGLEGYINLYKNYSKRLVAEITTIKEYIANHEILERVKQAAINDLAKRLRVDSENIKVVKDNDLVSGEKKLYRVTLLHQYPQYGPLDAEGTITPQPYGTYTYHIKVNQEIIDTPNGTIIGISQGVPTYQITRVSYFDGAYDIYRYGPRLMIEEIEQYDKDGNQKATISYIGPDEIPQKRIQTIAHYEIGKDGEKSIKYVDEYQYVDERLSIDPTTLPLFGFRVLRYESELRTPETKPLCTFFYEGKPGLEELIRCDFENRISISYKDNLAREVWQLARPGSKGPDRMLFRFEYDMDEYGNVLSTKVIYSDGREIKYEGLIDPVDVVVEYALSRPRTFEDLAREYLAKELNVPVKEVECVSAVNMTPGIITPDGDYRGLLGSMTRVAIFTYNGKEYYVKGTAAVIPEIKWNLTQLESRDPLVGSTKAKLHLMEELGLDDNALRYAGYELSLLQTNGKTAYEVTFIDDENNIYKVVSIYSTYTGSWRVHMVAKDFEGKGILRKLENQPDYMQCTLYALEDESGNVIATIYGGGGIEEVLDLFIGKEIEIKGEYFELEGQRLVKAQKIDNIDIKHIQNAIGYLKEIVNPEDFECSWWSIKRDSLVVEFKLPDGTSVTIGVDINTGEPSMSGGDLIKDAVLKTRENIAQRMNADISDVHINGIGDWSFMTTNSIPPSTCDSAEMTASVGNYALKLRYSHSQNGYSGQETTTITLLSFVNKDTDENLLKNAIDYLKDVINPDSYKLDYWGIGDSCIGFAFRLKDGSVVKVNVDINTGQPQMLESLKIAALKTREGIAQRMGVDVEEVRLNGMARYCYTTEILLPPYPVPARPQYGVTARVDQYMLTLDYYTSSYPPIVLTSFVNNKTGRDYVKEAYEALLNLFNPEDSKIGVSSWWMNGDVLKLNIDLSLNPGFIRMEGSDIPVDVDLGTGKVTIYERIVDAVTKVREEISKNLHIGIDGVYVNGIQQNPIPMMPVQIGPDGEIIGGNYRYPIYTLEASTDLFNLTFGYYGDGTIELASLVNKETRVDLVRTTKDDMVERFGFEYNSIHISEFSTSQYSYPGLNEMMAQEVMIFKIKVDGEETTYGYMVNAGTGNVIQIWMSIRLEDGKEMINEVALQELEIKSIQSLGDFEEALRIKATEEAAMGVFNSEGDGYTVTGEMGKPQEEIVPLRRPD